MLTSVITQNSLRPHPTDSGWPRAAGAGQQARLLVMAFAHATCNYGTAAGPRHGGGSSICSSSGSAPSSPRLSSGRYSLTGARSPAWTPRLRGRRKTLPLPNAGEGRGEGPVFSSGISPSPLTLSHRGRGHRLSQPQATLRRRGRRVAARNDVPFPRLCPIDTLPLVLFDRRLIPAQTCKSPPTPENDKIIGARRSSVGFPTPYQL
jgi:hypothetical protein